MAMETMRSPALPDPATTSPAKTNPAKGIAALAWLALGALLLCGSVPVAADIILLTNGKTLEGTLEELGNGKVRVRLAYGSLSFSQDQIATVHPARTFEEIVDETLADLDPGDAEGRYRLARQAHAEQSHTLYRRLLEEVVAIHPNHEPARRELGYFPHEGDWVTEEQLHALRGEVSFRGEWMTPQARDRILVAEAEARQSARDRSQARAEARQDQRQAELAARREAEAQAAAQAALRPVTYGGFLQPGCNFGFGTGTSFGGTSFGGAWGSLAAGPAFQPLQPFQPGQIQVPNQIYRYSLRQTLRARPGHAPRPYVGYRGGDPLPPRR